MQLSSISTAARAIAPFLVLATVGACNIEILHDISEAEANEVVAVLQRSGLPAQKERVAEGSSATYTISVRRGDAPRAWSVLRQQNLPRPKEQGLGEVFGDVGLVPTRTQERALLRHALAGEVSRTLNSIDGVRHARVHLVLPRRDPLADPRNPPPEPRASVLLKVDAALKLTETDIRQLVAGSVEGLSQESVNVVFSRSDSSKASVTAPGETLVSLGPFAVARRSRTALTVTLVFAVCLILGLALALLLILRQNRALTRSVAAARREGPAHPATEASLQLLERSITRYPGTR